MKTLFKSQVKVTLNDSQGSFFEFVAYIYFCLDVNARINGQYLKCDWLFYTRSVLTCELMFLESIIIPRNFKSFEDFTSEPSKHKLCFPFIPIKTT